MPNTGILTNPTQRPQTTMIETTIKPEATVETTERGTSGPETTTIQHETSILPACVCTCKIATHILSGFTLEENVRYLIENTVIDQKGCLRIGRYQRMMGECIRVLLVGSGLLAYVHGHNYLD